jgi:hypothetical protein
MQRAVDAVVAIEPSRIVSTGHLIEDLWGGKPPRTVQATSCLRTRDTIQPACNQSATAFAETEHTSRTTLHNTLPTSTAAALRGQAGFTCKLRPA